MATMSTENGYRLGWNGEVFAFGRKIGNRWFYQCLSLDCRAMGDADRAKVRTSLAHLVKHLRAKGERLSIRQYRAASGSRRRVRA